MRGSRRALVVAASFMTLGIAAGGMFSAGPVSAGVNVDITVAPPAPRVEVVPPHRSGYVWAPGYWEWRGHEHVWVSGRWMAERHGYRWVPDRWEQHGDRWHRYPGHWER
jgi:hypothetical protein